MLSFLCNQDSNSHCLFSNLHHACLSEKKFRYSTMFSHRFSLGNLSLWLTTILMKAYTVKKCNFTLHWTYKWHVNLLEWKFNLNVIVQISCKIAALCAFWRKITSNHTYIFMIYRGRFQYMIYHVTFFYCVAKFTQ